MIVTTFTGEVKNSVNFSDGSVKNWFCTRVPGPITHGSVRCLERYKQMLTIRCFKCGWGWSMTASEVGAALDQMQAEHHAKYYMVECPNCNRILYVKPENIPEFNKMQA